MFKNQPQQSTLRKHGIDKDFIINTCKASNTCLISQNSHFKIKIPCNMIHNQKTRVLQGFIGDDIIKLLY